MIAIFMQLHDCKLVTLQIHVISLNYGSLFEIPVPINVNDIMHINKDFHIVYEYESRFWRNPWFQNYY